MTPGQIVRTVRQLCKLHNPRISERKRKDVLEALENIQADHRAKIKDMQREIREAEREAEYLRHLLKRAGEVIELRAATKREIDDIASQRRMICRRIENVVNVN